MQNSSSRQPALVRSLASPLALLGALGMLGFSASAQAGVAAPAQCDEALGTPAISFIPGSFQSSLVTDTVSDNGDNTWTYEFRVCNTSDPFYGDFIRDWELPWDPNAGIIDIQVPHPGFGWSWAIETRDQPNQMTGWEGDISWQDPLDPFYDPDFAFQPQVLHFYSGCEGFSTPEELNAPAATPDGPADCSALIDDWIAPGAGLLGFSFTAGYGPTNAPYQASWAELEIQTGDPRFPGAPGGFSPGFLTPNAAPEPASLMMLGGGLGGLGLAALARRRRRKSEQDSSGGAAE